MARAPIVPVRVDAETKDRWEAAARDDGSSLSDFIRDSVEERITTATTAAPRATRKSRAATKAPRQTTATTAPQKRGARTSMCEHRRPADQFCSRCDA